DQRAGNREHHLRRRRGSGRANQPRWRAVRGAAEKDSRGEQRHPGSASRHNLTIPWSRSGASHMTTVHRVHNFSAGPAVLPLSVLEEIQRDLVSLPGVGMSILEISHRSAAFEAILSQAEADIRTLAAIPSPYKVLFLQGGASLQFSMVPMNLLTAGSTADY